MRTYFAHIPKTAGVTLKTFLENNYAAGESLVVDERAAITLPAGELNRYRLWSGHYPSEVLHAIAPRPDVVLVVVRDPVARLRSWAAHGRRLTDPESRAIYQGRSDAALFDAAAPWKCVQAWWLARALRDGADSMRVPQELELPALLDEVDLVGLTEELDRFMQLVSWRLGWPPPPLGWHINRRPDAVPRPPRADDANEENANEEDAALRARLGIDEALYRQASARFWDAYAAMTARVAPPDHHAEAGPQAPPVTTVQRWLTSAYARRHAAGEPASTLDVDAGAPLAGDNWWWREHAGTDVYRWTGPDTDATLPLPPLARGRDYDLTIDLMGAADWPTWDGVGVRLNGEALAVVREVHGPSAGGSIRLRLRASIPQAVAASIPPMAGAQLKLTVPGARAMPGRPLITESRDTTRLDDRLVGVAVQRVTIRPASQSL